MDSDPPPAKPPDPVEDIEISSHNSPVSTSVLGRKRQMEKGNVENTSNKKIITDPSSSAPSVQTIYAHPDLSDISKKYTLNDKGPFTVYVSREIADPAAGTTIRAIKFGQFLFKNKIGCILKDGIKNVGRNKIAVDFSTGQAANNFIENPILSQSHYKAYIPTFNITRMGLVRGVPVDWHLDEFLSSLDLPTGCGEVLKLRRLNRKVINDGTVAWIPTQSVVITFRGQMLPSYIYSYHSSLPVVTYLFPTIQCMNCCRFGHVKSQCRSRPRCYKCAQDHSGDSCTTTTDYTCLLCLGNHMATDRNCMEHSRQQSIKKVMSEENISYADASSRFPSARPSYADMAKQMFTPAQIPATTFSYNTASANKLPSQKPSNPNPLTSKSYRQTIARNSRPRLIAPKGYDFAAHQAIINHPSSSLNNGCALRPVDHSYALPSTSGDLTPILKESLKNISEKFKNTTLPPNAAQLFSIITSFLQHGVVTNCPVEL